MSIHLELQGLKLSFFFNFKLLSLSTVVYRVIHNIVVPGIQCFTPNTPPVSYSLQHSPEFLLIPKTQNNLIYIACVN